MFKEALQSVVERTEGGMACLLMDSEGIPVESFAREDAAFDIDTVGAEFSVVVKSIQRASESLEAGEPAEFSVLSGKMITVIRMLNSEYFVAVALDPSANVGKARYVLRTTAPTIMEQL